MVTGPPRPVRRLKARRIAAVCAGRYLPALAVARGVRRLRRLDVAVPLAGLAGWTVAEALLEDEEANRAAVGSVDDAGTKRLMVGAHLLSWWAPVVETALSRKRRSFRWLAAGVAAQAAGSGLRLTAVRTLGRSFTGHVAISEDHALCDRGLYRWIRHPAYTGLFLINLAPAIAMGAPVSALAVGSATAATTGRRVCAEERALSVALGEAYRHYAERTPRYLPRPWDVPRAASCKRARRYRSTTSSSGTSDAIEL